MLFAVKRLCQNAKKSGNARIFLTFWRSGKLASATFRQLFFGIKLPETKRNQGKAMVSRSFIAILSFAGKDASRPPAFVRLIQPSWRGERNDRPASGGAAFRPQGVERVNRRVDGGCKRRNRSLVYTKSDSPQILCFFFHSLFDARPEGGKSCAASLPINLSLLQRFGR